MKIPASPRVQKSPVDPEMVQAEPLDRIYGWMDSWSSR